MLRRASGWVLAAALLAGCSDPSRGVPIFLFHAVGADCAPAPYAIPREEFARELDDLQRWGATTITLAQLFDAREGKAKLPARPVILTFDDGRACQLTDAMGLLLGHHMVAETFVNAAFLHDAERYVEQEGGRSYGYLTWGELEQMQASGAFVIESHGLGHPRLPTVDAKAQRAEIVDSRAQLAARLGHPIDFFAYPFGSNDRPTRALVEQAGYRGALAVQSGWGGRWAMKRISLHAGDEGALQAALREAFGPPKVP